MRKLFRAVVACTLALTLFVVARPAWSDNNTANALAPSLAPTLLSAPTLVWTTSTTIALLPFATTGAIVYFVVVKQKEDKNKLTPPGSNPADAGGMVWMSEEEAQQWAFMYLRDNNEQLAQELGSGNGRVINDLATVLQISESKRPLFASTLQAHAPELLALARKPELTKARAAEFFIKLGAVLNAEPALKADLDALSQKLG